MTTTATTSSTAPTPGTATTSSTAPTDAPILDLIAERWSRYDAGQAGAHLTLQAQALGLHTHAMGGFDWAALAADFGLGADHDVQTVVAVGRLGSADLLEGALREREHLPRRRRPLAELVIR